MSKLIKILLLKLLFPEDIIYNILVYLGKIVDRNGRYMTRIPNKDLRYKIFEQISRPIQIRYFSNPNNSRNSMYEINFRNPEHKMYITIVCRNGEKSIYTLFDNSIGRIMWIDNIH